MSEQVVAAAAPAAAESPVAQESLENSAENLESQEAEASEGAEESQEEAAEAQKSTKEAKKAAKKAEARIKKLKLKVDGKELEEELNLDDDEALVRHLQMAKMGQKRAQEKADLEKQLGMFFNELQKNPLSVLAREFKMDPTKLIDEYINQQLENAKKTPEQLEKERLEQELQALKAEREREKEEGKQKELERLQQQEFERYDMLMEQALTKSDLPKTPYIVKKIADYMLVGLNAGYDVSPDDVIPLVREEMHKDLSEMFNSLPEDAVEQLLGEQMLNKLRKRRVAKAQTAQAQVAKPAIKDIGKTAQSEKAEAKDKKSFKDFFGI